MAEALLTLIAFLLVFGLCAAYEQATRPKEMHRDDWMAEGNQR